MLTLREMTEEIVALRDRQGITAWEEMPRGMNRRTFARSPVHNDDNVIMLVRTRGRTSPSQAIWFICSISSEPNVILMGGVVQGHPDIIEDAKRQATEALDRLNPTDPATYTTNLSTEDQHLFWHLDICNEVGEVFSQDLPEYLHQQRLQRVEAAIRNANPEVLAQVEALTSSTSE